jgi:hypothetical protein
MKRLKKIYRILLFIVLSTFVISCNQGGKTKRSMESYQVSTSDTAEISFNEYEHNFGKVIEGEKVACIFTFKDTGKGPLVISSATTSCGCTVSKYNSKPVPPGGSGTIEVVFNSSGYNGMQTKTVTIKSNASKPIVLLKITGEVITSTNN